MPSVPAVTIYRAVYLQRLSQGQEKARREGGEDGSWSSLGAALSRGRDDDPFQPPPSVPDVTLYTVCHDDKRKERKKRVLVITRGSISWRRK